MTGERETGQWDWRELGSNALVLVALASLAVTQPVLDLFGRNPEFFVAGDQSSLQIVLFGVVVTLLVPVFAIGVEIAATAARPRAGVVAHRVLVGLLATGFGLTLARELGFDRTVIVAAVALVVAGVVTSAETLVPGARRLLRYLAPASLLFLAFFLFASDSADLIWSSEADAVGSDQVGSALDAPLVVLQLDEFPVSSLLRTDGTINEERYPNFARLAGSSTWFRNASAVSYGTTTSVPSVVTGLMPEADRLPTSADHPRNLFTLLGNSHEMRVHEPVTDLCPSTVCAQDVLPAASAGGADVSGGGSSLFDVLSDAAVVYGHATLPAGFRSSLPDIDHSWGGFLDDVEPAPPASSRAADPVEVAAPEPGEQQDPLAFVTEWLEQGADTRAPPAQAATVQNLIAGLGPGPTVHYAHVLLPHFPWQLSPEGYRYSAEAGSEGFEERARWTENPDPVRQGLQRHLLQVGYLDALIGEMIDRLEEQGVWEDAMVVITADHGTAFVPGEPQREPTEGTLDEIYRVPLLIKFPGQDSGEIRDDNALLIDVLPTIVDALDLEIDWEFDGRSLLDDSQEPPTTKPVLGPDGLDTIPVSFDGVLDVVRRNDDVLGGVDGGWDEVIGLGGHGESVGDPVAELDPSGEAGLTVHLDQQEQFADVDLEGGFLPLLVTGRVDPSAGHRVPSELLLAVNGTVAGTAVDLGGGDDRSFSALLSPGSFREGANLVEALIPVGAAIRPATVAGGEGWTVEDGRLLAGDRSLPLTTPDESHRLQVEAVLNDGQALAVTGWAAGSGDAAEVVVVMADGHQLGAATIRERPDLEAFGTAAVGYEATVSSSGIDEGAELTAVAVFGDRAVAVPLDVESD